LSPQADVPRAFETLWSRPPFEVLALPGAGDTLVIAFASIAADPARMPAPEFVRSATAGGNRALFVMDMSRSWAQAPGFAEGLRSWVAALHARQPIGRIVTLGTSMGGYAALGAAAVLPVDAVLAFGPQWAPSAPTEPRWRAWTTGRHIPPPPLAAPWTVLFHALQDDGAQASAFPQRKGIDHLLFPALTHSELGTHLKARGVLEGLVQAAIANDRRRLIRIATSAGGLRRDRLQLPR
jgi:hypothetical protein